MSFGRLISGNFGKVCDKIKSAPGRFRTFAGIIAACFLFIQPSFANCVSCIPNMINCGPMTCDSYPYRYEVVTVSGDNWIETQFRDCWNNCGICTVKRSRNCMYNPEDGTTCWAWPPWPDCNPPLPTGTIINPETNCARGVLRPNGCNAGERAICSYGSSGSSSRGTFERRCSGNAGTVTQGTVICGS